MSTLKYRDSNNDYQGFYVKVTDTLPVGSVYLWGGITAPSGYLICDGRAVSRTEYADLFKAIGTNFGSGDGLTTFNIPDYRGRVPVGLDGSDVDFDTIGKKLGSKELQEHSHNYTRAPLYGAEWSGAQDVLAQNTSTGPAITATSNTAGTGNSGNIQPSLVTNYIIKASNKVALERGNVVDSLDGEDTDSAPSVRAVNEALKNFGKKLWEGSFTSGSISVPEAENYSFLVIMAGGVPMFGSKNYGAGGYVQYSGTQLYQQNYRLNYSSGTFIIDTISKGAYDSLGQQQSIEEIYGLF